MIKDIIDLLQLSDWYGVSQKECIKHQEIGKKLKKC
jgi:hypothetical protein